MSGELEDLQKGERFVVLDPAPIPTTPSAPRRALISLGGLLGGIIVGIGLAVTAEMADPSVRTDREATDIVGKPLLAGIPLIVTASLQRRNRMLALGVVTVALVCSAGFGFIASYLMRQTI